VEGVRIFQPAIPRRANGMMNSRGYDRVVHGPAARGWALEPEQESGGVESRGEPVVLAVGGLSAGAAEGLSSEGRLVVSEGGPLAWQVCRPARGCGARVGPVLRSSEVPAS
jgi:hypothetical protein